MTDLDRTPSKEHTAPGQYGPAILGNVRRGARCGNCAHFKASDCGQAGICGLTDKNLEDNFGMVVTKRGDRRRARRAPKFPADTYGCVRWTPK